MRNVVRSVGFRNAIGNIAGGAAFIVLAVLNILGVADGWQMAVSVACIILAVAAIVLNHVKGREVHDEMYWENLGTSATTALSLGLIVVCVIAAACLIVEPHAEIRVTDAAFFAVGVFQLLLGALFAWNERGDGRADD